MVRIQQLLAHVAVVQLEVLLQEPKHDRLGVRVAAHLKRRGQIVGQLPNGLVSIRSSGKFGWIRIHKLALGTGCIIRPADMDSLAAGSGVPFLKIRLAVAADTLDPPADEDEVDGATVMNDLRSKVVM